MLRCEHVLHPDLWIERPRYIVKITRPDGRVHTYGYDVLSHYELETALLNRIADIYDLEFMDHWNWNIFIPIEVVYKLDDPIIWQTNFGEIREAIKLHIKLLSKQNSNAYKSTNQKQTTS